MSIQEGDIEVSKKTLLHISEGIYRTEGSSIKELISNAFDARATKIVINTNYPNFDILTCQDNGEGMTEAEFLRIVKGGIGDSLKATASASERPIIGRLGIGILAIAQICRSFTIISHNEKTKTAFKGKMIFRTDVDKVAKEKTIKTDKNSNYDIGRWILEEKLEYDSNKKGVLIFTKDLRQSFVKRFKEDKIIKREPLNNASLEFESLLNSFYNLETRSIKELGAYYELIWEICQLAPLPYFEQTPIRKEFVKSIEQYEIEQRGSEFKDGKSFLAAKNKELLSYDFSVILDDIKLFRITKLPFPIQKKDHNQQSQIFYFEYNNVVRKRSLKFKAYFIAQENAIRPRDLKGVQIRIKNVGIGLNDSTFLKYDKIESPRDNWISGEIYVEEGLESALNIDRDSFNENDEHYFILKQEIHKFLASTVFPTVSALQRKRLKESRDNKLESNLQSLKKDLKKLFSIKSNYALLFQETDDGNIKINKSKRTIQFPVDILTAPFEKRRKFFAINVVDFISVLDVPKNELPELLNALSTILLK